MKTFKTEVFLKDYYLEIRHNKLYAVLGERLYEFLSFFQQAHPKIALGIFDDCDRMYLDMILGEQGLTIDTLDDVQHYKGIGGCSGSVAILKQIEGKAVVPDRLVSDAQAREFSLKTREMIYRIFGTNIVCVSDYKNPVAVLCKDYNAEFVINCINHYHGQVASVETFFKTPAGYSWVLSCGVGANAD